MIRRAISGLTAKNLNKNFERLAAEFLEKGASIQTLAKFFSKQTAFTIRFPGDEEFAKGIAEQSIYESMGRKERIVDILWELEKAARSKFQVDTARPDSLSIEHVMPQGWRTHWSLAHHNAAPSSEEFGEKNLASAEAARDQIIHTLGNLTLVTTPLNSSLSNGPFDGKKGPLKDSLLALNSQIAASPSWNEDAIAGRAASLAKLACNIWPGPDAYLVSVDATSTQPAI